MSSAKLFMAALMAEGSVAELLKHGPIDHLFKPHELELFEFIREFIKEFHALPQPETITAHTGEELPKPTEPADYYLAILKARYIELELKRSMQKSAEFLGTDNKNPEKALEVMTEAIMKLIAERHRRSINDFREAYALVVGDYIQQWNKDEDSGIRLGWPTLDAMTGGLVTGDMVSFVGRPQAGKTMQMLYAAYKPWLEQKRQVMFVSMEMKPLIIQQRLSAMHASIPMTWLKNAGLTTNSFNKLKVALTEIKAFDVPFWVVDGNFTTTVDDVWALATQLKPDVIFVDGAYLLKHPRERDRYKRVAENADLIKQQLSAIAPVICSWQFARGAAKKTKVDQVGLEDIAYSDAIGQVSSLVLGLFEGDSPETVMRRRIEILKGRNGEAGSFVTRWDWAAMRFEEILAEPIETLQFV